MTPLDREGFVEKWCPSFTLQFTDPPVGYSVDKANTRRTEMTADLDALLAAERERMVNDFIKYKLAKLHWVSHWYMKDVVRILDETLEEAHAIRKEGGG